jgi:hypothetical protein
MPPHYQSTRLQIWLLGTCCLLGPQGHVQERSENFRFSGATSMQVSTGWFIADCHQEISRTLIHLLVTHAYAVEKGIQTYAKHSSLFDLCLQNVSCHMPSSLPLQKSPHAAVLSSMVTGFWRAALYGQILVGVYHRKSFQALHSNICWRVIWFQIDDSQCFPTDLLQQKKSMLKPWILLKNQTHFCFASRDGNKSAYQSKIVGLSSACSS